MLTAAPHLLSLVTSDDDMRCVVSPRVPGVASVISLQLSPAELIGAETVKARHNVIMSPVSHHVAVTPGPVTPVQNRHQVKIKSLVG